MLAQSWAVFTDSGPTLKRDWLRYQNDVDVNCYGFGAQSMASCFCKNDFGSFLQRRAEIGGMQAQDSNARPAGVGSDTGVDWNILFF